MTNKNTNSYFAYSNTCYGFLDYFENILECNNIEKIYKIKNCGDKNFLNEIAQTASKKYFIEYFLNPCNLDCVDCIIIKELKTAVIAENSGKHFSFEEYPLIIENTIDFSQFYDERKLIEGKKEIISLIAKRNEYNNLTQKFLKAANELSENTIKLSQKYLYHEKINSAIDRLADKYVSEKTLQQNGNKNFINEYKFINRFPAFGFNELGAFENDADKIFFISNENFSGSLYTEKILGKFSHLCKVICPDAINPDKAHAVYIKDFKILFVIKDKNPDKIYGEKYNFINMDRFINHNFKRENKQKLRFINKCYKSLIDEAEIYFKEKEKTNTILDGIYTSAIINAKEKAKYMESIVKKIFP